MATRVTFALRAALRIARATSTIGYGRRSTVRDICFVFPVTEVVPSWAQEAECSNPVEPTERMRHGAGVDHAWTSSGPLPNVSEFYDALLIFAGGRVQDTRH